MDWTTDSIAIRSNSIDHVGIGDQGRICTDKLSVYALQGLISHLKLGIVYDSSAQTIDIRPRIRGGIHTIGACLKALHDIGGIPVTQSDLDGDGLEEITHLERSQFKG
jgi:hypothetical protein